MTIHISERDILEKKLNFQPFPKNLKQTQKLDEYIKEHVSEKKKLTTLNQETTLKETQEEMASILGSLTRLESIMEAERQRERETEREILPEEDDKAISGHMDIARLFEQKSLLICQSFVLETTEFVLIFSMIMLPK